MMDLQFHRKTRPTLSELPDDILLHILSSLTMKEAGRTSILAKRWRYLWSSIPALNFHPHLQLTMEISVAQKILEVDTPGYVSWVDQVLRSYNNRLTVDDFWVKCHLQADYVQNVDDWVRFAMKKKVKRLRIDVVLLAGGQLSHYTFPGSFSDDSLNYIKLTGVNVTGEALEKLLVDCPVLEFLCVENSDSLVDLKVVGQSLRLKYLEICYCEKIKKLEVSAPNLVHVTYHGPDIIVPFKSNPKLAKMSLGGDYAIALTNTFTAHSRYLSQLGTLDLILQCAADLVMKSFNNFPKLERLKVLSVHISPGPYLYFLRIMPLIVKCPFVHGLVLILKDDMYVTTALLRLLWPVVSHYHLKIVGLYGSAGLDCAIWLLNCAVFLEKIVIDHHKHLRHGIFRRFISCKEKREMAKQLGEHLKSGTDLVIF